MDGIALIAPDPAQSGPLLFVRPAEGDAVIMDALAIQSREEIPQFFFSLGDARRFAVYVEKHAKKFKTSPAHDPEVCKAILGDVGRMLKQSVEPRRRDVLLRWFRDPAAPADLNPMRLIDPISEAKGNPLQLLHPLLFDVMLLVICIAVAALVFAFWFGGGR